MKGRNFLISSAVLTVLLSLLAGCGGTAAPAAPAATPRSASQSGQATPPSAVAVVVTMTPYTGVATDAATATPAAAGGGGSSDTQLTPTAGGPNNTDSGAGLDVAAFDVCSLLTKDEVLALMPNVVFKSASSGFSPQAGVKTCTYADGEGTGALQLSLYTPDRWDSEVKVIGDSPEPVSGLGDAAVTETLTYAQVLSVLVKDKAAFELTVNPKNTSDGKYDTQKARDIAMQFAQKIIPRLR